MHTLVGRTEEVAVLHELLADGQPQPRAVLIDGESGIGKTSLLQHVLAAAREHGYLTLSHRPIRLEMDLSYVGLVELLGGVDDEIVDSLPLPQARVLRMILRRDEPDEALDRLSLNVAVVAVLRAVARARPVLLAVDDVQWLYHPTARALAFVARRLGGTTTRIVLVRTIGGWWAPPGPGREGHDSLEWLDELTRAVPEGRLDIVRLGPIGPSDLSRILRRVLGWVPPWPRLLKIAELSAGNPLYAVELARAFGSVRPDGDLDESPPDTALGLARSRVARLPDRVREGG